MEPVGSLEFDTNKKALEVEFLVALLGLFTIGFLMFYFGVPYIAHAFF